MFFFPLGPYVLEAVFAAGDRLPLYEQNWAAAMMEPLNKPFDGSHEEAKLRSALIVGRVLTEFETKALQNPHQEREWLTFARMLRYIQAMCGQDHNQLQIHENAFEATLRQFKAESLPS